MQSHLVVIAAFLLLQGLCEVSFGLSIFLASIWAGPSPIGMLQSEMTIRVVYAFAGMFCIAAGTLRLIAALCVMRHKRRAFVLFATIFGLVSCFACQCAPSSVALAFYTFGVLLTKQGTDAFRQ